MNTMYQQIFMINSKNNSVVTPEMPSSKLALSEGWNRGNIKS